MQQAIVVRFVFLERVVSKSCFSIERVRCRPRALNRFVIYKHVSSLMELNYGVVLQFLASVVKITSWMHTKSLQLCEIRVCVNTNPCESYQNRRSDAPTACDWVRIVLELLNQSL